MEPAQENLNFKPEAPLDVDLQRLIAGIDAETSYVVKLFARTFHPKNKSKHIQSFLCEWENEVPSMTDIANDYGPGDYRVQAYYEEKPGKQKIVTHDFYIDTRFKRRAPDPAPAQLPAPAPMSAAAPGSNQELLTLMINQQTQMMTAIFGLIGNIITANSGRGSLADDFKPFMEGFQSMMVESARSQMELVGDVARARLGVQDEPDGPEHEPGALGAIVAMLRGLWDNYGEQLLSAGKTKQKVMAELAQGTEQYKQLQQNPELLNAAINELVASGAPQDKIFNLLKILGFQMEPQQEPAPATTPDNGNGQ